MCSEQMDFQTGSKLHLSYFFCRNPIQQRINIAGGIYMSVKTETNFGVITIDEEVIARVAGCAAMDCYGIVGMAAKNMKDGLFQLLKVESLTKGIKVYSDEEEGTISLEFHIIVEYGTNISAIAENIINTVKFQIEECFGIKTDKINVFVEGVRVDER